MRCPICGDLYLYHEGNTVFACAQGHEWAWTESSHGALLTVRVPAPDKVITLHVVRAHQPQCPECMAKWNQEPRAWGDSMLELEAYDEHMREHTKIDPDEGRWEGEGGR